METFKWPRKIGALLPIFVCSSVEIALWNHRISLKSFDLFQDTTNTNHNSKLDAIAKLSASKNHSLLKIKYWTQSIFNGLGR